jgi:type VI secretion system protein ImpF
MVSRNHDARALLFDRLAEAAPRPGQEPFRTLDRAQLRASVRHELAQLFNTRCASPADWLAARELTVLDYGIPDFGHMSPGRGDDRVSLATSMRRAIAAYEPRLRNVRVTVDPASTGDRDLRVHIDAELVVDSVPEPVAFYTRIQPGSGRIEVHDHDES